MERLALNVKTHNSILIKMKTVSTKYFTRKTFKTYFG